MPPRVRPPPQLTQDVRAVFVEVVASKNPDHFQTGDLPLLVELSDDGAVEPAVG
jgi:hypothetical protein